MSIEISCIPQYASWDLAFHMVPFAVVDLDFAKEQLMLFLREWYMHPNGQIPGMITRTAKGEHYKQPVSTQHSSYNRLVTNSDRICY